jgi:putative flippase GtrA
MKLWDEAKKFIKFNIVGIINTVVDVAAYTALTALGLNIALAQGISYSLGTANSYLFNSRWTFKDKQDSLKRVALFIVVNLVSYGVSTALLYFYEAQWDLAGFWAKLAALPFSTVVNLKGMRLVVFKEAREEPEEKP